MRFRKLHNFDSDDDSSTIPRNQKLTDEDVVTLCEGLKFISVQPPLAVNLNLEGIKFSYQDEKELDKAIMGLQFLPSLKALF